MRQAGITLADVDVLEHYDCYTYTVLVTPRITGSASKDTEANVRFRSTIMFSFGQRRHLELAFVNDSRKHAN